MQVERVPGAPASWVWLRRDVTQDVAEEAQADGGVTSQDVWTYEELCFVADGTPTEAEVEAAFDELWADHEDDGMADAERIARAAEAATAAQAQADYTAVMTDTVLPE